MVYVVIQPLLSELQYEVKQAFEDVGITGEEYEVLKGLDTSELSLTQLVQVL